MTARFAWALALVAALAQVQAAEREALDALRRSCLGDVHVLRDYRAGKNSFVEGPDRRLGCYRTPGQRLTLLDVAGEGSLCHIWSTWRPGQGAHRLDFFVDGEPLPRIAATLDELVAAGAEMADPPVPAPGFIGNRGARNLFVPVPFSRGLRVEMETIEPTWLIFWQLDYRLRDQSRVGQALCASREDGPLRLRYEGPKPAATQPEPERRTIRHRATVPALGEAVLATLSGPAVLRRWSMRPDIPMARHNELALDIRFDGAAAPAVRAPVGDFFGPFAGASLHSDTNSGLRTCWLPAPFRKEGAVRLENRGREAVVVDFEAECEPVAAWNDGWGYFHALGGRTERTTGFRQHQVMYTRGRGHWLGMALYGTGHDHGGGDFAVIDAEGDAPAFLHGINGEDYFTFAWFGRGEHQPYAAALSNDQGRYRHHFENPYPFRTSLSVYWGTFPDLSPRSVAYWYQDSAEDLTVPDGANPLTAEWDCFGPVPLPREENGRTPDGFWEALPTVADLDAGGRFACRCVNETFESGWRRQRSIGPMLDLTYLARHGTRIKGEIELGGMGHAFLARRRIESAAARTGLFQLSHDDPIRVLLNGAEVHRGLGGSGFVTERFSAALRAGENELVVQAANFFNVNFNWAGFSLRQLDP